MTPTSVAALLKVFITECKGDTSRINLSYASANRYRVEAANNIALKIRENWAPPQKGIIHWDGKLMDTLDGSSKAERLPILLSGVGGSKVLGVPQLPNLAGDLSGNLISSATLQLLDA